MAAFAWLISRDDLWALALGALFPGRGEVLYPGGSLADLTLRHLEIVALSSALTVGVGLPLGVWVTRPSGADFRDIVSAVVDFGQAFPPVAVLALAIPVLGLGLYPTVFALFLYGLFPVVSGTVAGLEGVSPPVLDAARGMGMGRWRILFTVELPLAGRVIMGGIRSSVAINIGTATVAAVVGAGGLGNPIIGGMVSLNLAYVTQGAVACALLAVLADAALAQAEKAFLPVGAS